MFRKYLLAKGILTRDDVVEVRRNQLLRDKFIGRAAIEAGFLTYAEASRIREHQQKFGLRYGEAAVGLGLLSEDNLAKLLRRQAEARVNFLEVLLDLELVDRSILEHEIERYQKETGRDPHTEDDRFAGETARQDRGKKAA